ncbi:TRAP transporter substrate-binding protein [Arenibaculum pallidiluteum]|uniref:TRAP transporter substrate-binding protein n=1 Tax=Arenibaculum pallidiluteum TaxID=2812559 RepID=UPI001A96BE35|nr:TRAP transporter substrate-binding protein [Arenibaculum pallidiluteum]
MTGCNLLKAAIAAVALSCAAAAPASADIQKVQLNVVGGLSNLSQYKNYEQPFWTKRITEASGGKVTATITGFNDMGLKGPEILRLMSQGVIEFGTTVLGYTASDDPRNEAVDLAGIAPDIDTAHRVADVYKPVLDAFFRKKYGVKVLGLWPYPAQVLYCNKPISGLADLAGKKVRTGNRTLAEFTEALGGSGVTMAFAEVVPALQKGVVDCAITGTLSGNSAKWHEVSSHLYALPVGWSTLVHGVNLKTWNKLNAETQTFIEREIASLEDQIWKAAGEETQEGINCNIGQDPCVNGTKAKMTLVPVSDADRQKLTQVVNSVIVPKWVQRCGADCADEFNKTIGQVIGASAAK